MAAELFQLKPCNKCGDVNRYLSNFRCVTCQRHQSLKRGNARNATTLAGRLRETEARIKLLEIELKKYRHKFGDFKND